MRGCGCAMSATEAVRSTVYLEPELHQALRLKSAHSQRSMSDIVNEALREDQEDLASVRARAKETALTYEDFLTKLKEGGAS